MTSRVGRLRRKLAALLAAQLPTLVIKAEDLITTPYSEAAMKAGACSWSTRAQYREGTPKAGAWCEVLSWHTMAECTARGVKVTWLSEYDRGRSYYDVAVDAL